MIKVYSKKNCPACDTAKKFLVAKGIDFSEVRIDENDIAREFLISSGHRTVPQIYKDGILFVKTVDELAKKPLEEFV